MMNLGPILDLLNQNLHCDTVSRSSVCTFEFETRSSHTSELLFHRNWKQEGGRQDGKNYLPLLTSISFLSGLMRPRASSHLVSVDAAGSPSGHSAALFAITWLSDSLAEDGPDEKTGSFSSPAQASRQPSLACGLLGLPASVCQERGGHPSHPKLLCLCKMFSEKLPSM